MGEGIIWKERFVRNELVRNEAIMKRKERCEREHKMRNLKLGTDYGYGK